MNELELLQIENKNLHEEIGSLRENSQFLKNLIENLQYQVKLLKAFRFSQRVRRYLLIR